MPVGPAPNFSTGRRDPKKQSSSVTNFVGLCARFDPFDLDVYPQGIQACIGPSGTQKDENPSFNWGLDALFGFRWMSKNEIVAVDAVSSEPLSSAIPCKQGKLQGKS